MASLMARRHRDEADQDVKRARAVLKRFAVANAPSMKYVEACERLDSAARNYGVAEMPHKAADCYKLAAEMCLRQVTTEEQAAKRNVFASGVCAEGEVESIVFSLRAARLDAKLDPALAREATRDAIRTCCDYELYDLAAELQRSIIKMEQEPQRLIEMHRLEADLLDSAVKRQFKEEKRSSKRRALLEAAKLEATEEKYTRAAAVFEDLATDVQVDNLTAANSVRLFFKAGLCYLAARDHDLLRGKCNVFARQHVEFALAAERQFLLDVAECSSSELPDHDRFVDLAYYLSEVRKLDSWELGMLGTINGRMVQDIAYHEQLMKDEAERVAAEKQAEKEQREREERILRDEEALKKQMSRNR